MTATTNLLTAGVGSPDASTTLQSLYLLGMPWTVFSTAIPFIILPGDGGTNGLTFTGGGGGAFTLSAAPLSGLLNGLASRGCYGWLPANAGGSGNTAGWYYLVPSSDTAGTFYADTYTGGQPALVSSPTTFAGSPSGRITQTTSEVTALSGVNMTPVGNNGSVEWKLLAAGDTASGNKNVRMKFGAVTGLTDTTAASPVDERLLELRNGGSQSIQTASRQQSGVGVGAANLFNNFTAIDLSGATTALTITLQLTANTGCIVLLASSFTQKYRS